MHHSPSPEQAWEHTCTQYISAPVHTRVGVFLRSRALSYLPEFMLFCLESSMGASMGFCAVAITVLPKQQPWPSKSARLPSFPLSLLQFLCPKFTFPRQGRLALLGPVSSQGRAGSTDTQRAAQQSSLCFYRRRCSRASTPNTGAPGLYREREKANPRPG